MRRLRVRNHTFANVALRACAWTFAHIPGGNRNALPRNILVIRLGNVGDIVVSIPAFRALKQMYPDARFTLLTSPTERGAPGARELLANDRTFSDFFVYYADESGRPGFLRELRRQLIQRRFDMAVALPNHRSEWSNVAKHLALMALSGVRRYRGFQLVTRRDHEIRQVDRLLRLVGSSGADVTAFPWISLSERDVGAAAGLLPADKGRVLIGMHPGAKRPANRWAVESFAQTGLELIERINATILITGSAGEKDLTAEVASRIGAQAVDLGGKTPLTVLAALARNCDAFISNDTGVMHVAYAMGAPVVAIFSGRFHANVWYPYGDRQIVLRKHIECELCDGDACPLYDYPACLAQISPGEVVDATLQLLDRRKGSR